MSKERSRARYSRLSLIKKNKRADSKYDIILAIMVGIIVVAIVLFWIFQEFFTKADVDWQTCRESLIVRNSLPEKDVVAGYVSTKSMLPLKCGTNVINIDYKNVTRAEQEIGQAASECWYMVGRGEYEVFPGSSSVLGGVATPCMACSRIHLDDKVKDYYTKNKISIRDAFNTQLKGYDVTVWDYLNPEKGKKATTYFGGWNDSGFYVKYSTTAGLFGSRKGFNPENNKIFYFPTYFDPDKGDFFMMYSEPTKELSTQDGNRIAPYMVFLQYADFDKLSKYWSFYETPGENAIHIGGIVVSVAAFAAATVASGGTSLVLVGVSGATAGKTIGHMLFNDKNSIRVCSSIETVPS